MKVFHLPLSEFQDLGLARLCAIFCVVNPLYPLVYKRNVSATVFPLEENAVVRREKRTMCGVT